MSFLTGTATVLHSSKLPAGSTREQGVAMLRDHAFFLRCDPHLVQFSELKGEDGQQEQPQKPSHEQPGGRPLPERVAALSPTRSYRVVDLVHNLPAGLWDSNVVSTYEITDIEDGIFVRIRSPMSVVMDTFWEIRRRPAAAAGAREGDVGDVGGGGGGGGAEEKEEKDEDEGGVGEWEMVEDITISASRLILGLVKSLCEGGWAKIHDKMLERLRKEDEVKKGGEVKAPALEQAKAEVQVQAG